jgi:hypothetical protein
MTEDLELEPDDLTCDDVDAANEVAAEIIEPITWLITMASETEEVDYSVVLFSVWHDLTNLLLDAGWTADNLSTHSKEHVEALGPDTEGSC